MTKTDEEIKVFLEKGFLANLALTCAGNGRLSDILAVENHFPNGGKVELITPDNETLMLDLGVANVLAKMPADGVKAEEMGQKGLHEHALGFITKYLMPQGLVEKVGEDYIRTPTADKSIYSVFPNPSSHMDLFF